MKIIIVGDVVMRKLVKLPNRDIISMNQLIKCPWPCSNDIFLHIFLQGRTHETVLTSIIHTSGLECTAMQYWWWRLAAASAVDAIFEYNPIYYCDIDIEYTHVRQLMIKCSLSLSENFEYIAHLLHTLYVLGKL